MPDALTQPFIDRREAGAGVLAQQLRHYAYRADAIVLALPRGGVPVGYEAATGLGLRLDVILVRKLGVPGQPELAMGAIAPGGVRVLNSDVVSRLGIAERTVDVVADAELRELDRGERLYRRNQPRLELRAQTPILTDDGLVTGSTIPAAVQGACTLGAARVVVATPVGAPEACRAVVQIADEVICARRPARFQAVGQWYLNFPQTTDADVNELLSRARQALAAMQP